MTASSVLASCHKRPIRGIFALVCPRAASGHATAPPSTPRNARRFMSNPRLRRRHRVVMTKASTLEGGWNGPRVQVIAPHDQCLRWVKPGLRAPSATLPLSHRQRNSTGRRAMSHSCQQRSFGRWYGRRESNAGSPICYRLNIENMGLSWTGSWHEATGVHSASRWRGDCVTACQTLSGWSDWSVVHLD